MCSRKRRGREDVWRREDVCSRKRRGREDVWGRMCVRRRGKCMYLLMINSTTLLLLPL